MSNLSIFSEIARLRAVAVHSPGREVDCMTPSLMHQLLFDDILFGKEAREEHGEFAKILAKVADEVVDIQDLLAQTLEMPLARAHFLDRLAALHHLTRPERETLEQLSPRILAQYAVTGWYEEIDHGADYRFRFPPVPNLLFMRDPAAVIGEGVSIHNMATSARRPEPFVLDVILRFHPRFRVDREENIWFDAIPSYLAGNPDAYHTIEGGDILVLSEKILAIGVSIRTSQSAVTRLAETIRGRHSFKTVFAVLMPQERSVMHLDTIFTQIDPENCLIFPPMLKPGRSGVLPTIKMDLSGKSLTVALKDNFLDALAEEGHKLNPVFCGGRNRLDQEREQWTDGANAFCLAPGVILGYSRNTATADELDRVGYQVVNAERVLAEDWDLLDGNRYFVLIKGNELSRARGGPRCMTMPLKRDPLP